jgi:integrase
MGEVSKAKPVKKAKKPEKRWRVSYRNGDGDEILLGVFPTQAKAEAALGRVTIAEAYKVRSPRTRGGSVTSIRRGLYQVRYTHEGRRLSGGYFRTKQDAEDVLKNILDSIQDGTWVDKYGPNRKPPAEAQMTVRELSARYLKTRTNKRGGSLSVNTSKEYPRLVDRVLGNLADRPIDTIDSVTVEDWWTDAKEAAPAQAAKTYVHLKSIFKYAVKRKWVKVNPCDIEGASNYAPAVPPPIPTDTEVVAMVQAAEDPMRTIVALAAYCGLRKGEILELRRKDFFSEELANGETWWFVTVSRGVVWDGENTPIVSRPKTESSVRTLAIPKKFGAEDIVLERLRQIPQHPDSLLVSKDQAGKIHWGESMLNPRWQKLRALGDYGGRFHSLRAYHLTWYGQQGASDVEVMARGGHATHRVSMLYQRTTGREASLLSK